MPPPQAGGCAPGPPWATPRPAHQGMVPACCTVHMVRLGLQEPCWRSARLAQEQRPEPIGTQVAGVHWGQRQGRTTMAEGRTILVVDDEPDLLNAVRLYLEDEGYQVLTATNGEEALAKVRTRLPDLIVLDVMMPEMNGFEALGEIRRVSNVPVIMLTVKGEESDKVRGLGLGADDYVTKPF